METKNIIAWGIALLLLWAFFWALRRIKNSQPPPDEEDDDNIEYEYRDIAGHYTSYEPQIELKKLFKQIEL